MKKKTRGTIALVCGIICVLSEALILVLSLVFPADFGGETNVLSTILFLALGVYFCYLGIKMRKEDN